MINVLLVWLRPLGPPPITRTGSWVLSLYKNNSDHMCAHPFHSLCTGLTECSHGHMPYSALSKRRFGTPTPMIGGNPICETTMDHTFITFSVYRDNPFKLLYSLFTVQNRYLILIWWLHLVTALVRGILPYTELRLSIYVRCLKVIL